MSLIGIPSNRARDVWPLADKWLHKAIKRTRGLMTGESIIAACEARDQQLWIISDDSGPVGAAVTEVRDLRTGDRSVHVLAAGADYEAAVIDAQTELERWAQSIGANRITMDGRLGWMRRLKDWRFVSVMMEKSIV